MPESSSQPDIMPFVSGSGDLINPLLHTVETSRNPTLGLHCILECNPAGTHTVQSTCTCTAHLLDMSFYNSTTTLKIERTWVQLRICVKSTQYETDLHRYRACPQLWCGWYGWGLWDDGIWGGGHDDLTDLL